MFLPRITPQDLESPERLAAIFEAPDTYYWTDDWSADFYVRLAKLGFINITTEVPMLTEDRVLTFAEVLAPEMQSAYAVLDFENLRVSRSMRRWMRSDACRRLDLQLRIPVSLDAVVAGISKSYGGENWVVPRYVEILRNLENLGGGENFELIPVGLVNPAGVVVAGEIGYRVGRIYTSLTGFFDRSNPVHSNTGKLQLFELGKWLAERDFAFWNLGHPYMQYKLDLGAKIVERSDFLRRWNEAARRDFSQRRDLSLSPCQEDLT